MYCDRATRAAFCRLFQEFFRIIPELTGAILKLAAFFPGNLSAKLKTIILDGEVAQAQGLADFLVMYVAMNNVEVPGGLRGGFLLLKLVLKLCSVHFERYVCNFMSINIVMIWN